MLFRSTCIASEQLHLKSVFATSSLAQHAGLLVEDCKSCTWTACALPSASAYVCVQIHLSSSARLESLTELIVQTVVCTQDATVYLKLHMYMQSLVLEPP